MNSGKSSLSGQSVLVAHPWMGSGGSEATVMWALEALQDAGASPTLFTSSDFELDRFNRTYGTSVDPTALTFKRARPLPFVNSGSRLAHWQSAWFQRQCRNLAGDFDLLISGYNLVDFGRPGIQLIGDYTWHEELRRELDPDADHRRHHRNHWLRRAYLKLGDWIRNDHSRPITRRGDLVLANSQWTRQLLESRLGFRRCPILYPPVGLPPASHQTASKRNPMQFVCLGRISPEKRIESMIRMLLRVRESGHPVSLAIAGSADGSRYGAQIQSLVTQHREWIHLTGFLQAKERDELLRTASYGIHARPAEAFGIAVAEMAGSGCLPFVPNQGGPAEIVTRPEFRFENESDAVEKIIQVLEASDADRADMRDGLAGSVRRFFPDAFMKEFQDQVEGFLEGRHPGAIRLHSHHAPRFWQAGASRGQRPAHH